MLCRGVSLSVYVSVSASAYLTARVSPNLYLNTPPLLSSWKTVSGASLFRMFHFRPGLWRLFVSAPPSQSVRCRGISQPATCQTSVFRPQVLNSVTGLLCKKSRLSLPKWGARGRAHEPALIWRRAHARPKLGY